VEHLNLILAIDEAGSTLNTIGAVAVTSMFLLYLYRRDREHTDMHRENMQAIHHLSERHGAAIDKIVETHQGSSDKHAAALTELASKIKCAEVHRPGSHIS
jgi:hypothetical protein